VYVLKAEMVPVTAEAVAAVTAAVVAAAEEGAEGGDVAETEPAFDLTAIVTATVIVTDSTASVAAVTVTASVAAGV
jgi:hypothetical protein